VLADSRLTSDIPVSDLTVARDFYGGKLGLKLIKEVEGNELRFRVGDAILATYITQSAGKAEHTLASFRVTNLDAAMDELRAVGVEFEDYDLPGFRTVDGVVDWGHTREAWFKDPDGNVLSVGQLIEP